MPKRPLYKHGPAGSLPHAAISISHLTLVDSSLFRPPLCPSADFDQRFGFVGICKVFMCLFFSVCFWFSDGGFELLIAGLRTVKIVSIGLVRRNWHLFALPTILIYHHTYSESFTQPQSPLHHYPSRFYFVCSACFFSQICWVF